MKLTPIQESFSAGELSPLMYQRSDTKGYKEGLAELTNMFADSRGPVVSRGGMRYAASVAGDDGRIMAVPVNDLFFYTAIFTEHLLTIGSLAGHTPDTVYNDNAGFNFGGDGWSSGTDGNASSTVEFLLGASKLNVDKQNGRYVYVSQEVTIPTTGIHTLLWSFTANTSMTIKVGTTENGDDIYTTTVPSGRETEQFNATATTFWITAVLESDNTIGFESYLSYFGVSSETVDPVTFVSPYDEQHVTNLQGVANPSGNAVYVLHELYPPYKLMYDRALDAFSFEEVVFKDDSLADADNSCAGVDAMPPEWVAGSYPSCGDFFEGRLWLGGTVNEPQTFWGSKSGCPEVFVSDTLTNADSPLKFTMAKYGRIEWMVGFKNLVIGTQNGEHIVTSVGGFIKPDDIQVEQQSSYGSANVQPVQVGDQIFYVSADGRKLRAIQYEWQKDNWLSKDLTFNSEHITMAGIKHITWHQNPNNLFHCVLNDGTVATLTYERSNNVYGWAKIKSQGSIIDMCTGPILGTDYVNILVQYVDGSINYENQSSSQNVQYMDSWVLKLPEPDGVTVLGLDHLEGFEVQVLIDDAVNPDTVVSGGQITLQHVTPVEASVVVGLKFTSRMTTLPISSLVQSGTTAPYVKRWNKIYTRVLNSSAPLINGARTPERYPVSPMNETQPNMDEEIQTINLGFDKHAVVKIEQDLPRSLTVLGIFGEMAQSIT